MQFCVAACPTTAGSRAGSPGRPAQLHSVLMDRFVGQGRLEWWANQSICLEMYDIDITVTVDAVGKWRATGRHANALDATQREGWDFLMEMDPHFSIAFPGEDCGGITVRVVEAEDATLTLVEAPDWDGSVSVTTEFSSQGQEPDFATLPPTSLRRPLLIFQNEVRRRRRYMRLQASSSRPWWRSARRS